MRTVEQGFDKEGTQCWFVLDNANLIGTYYTEEEANSNL